MEKLKNIETLRFLLCTTVVYFHLLHVNLLNFTQNNSIYKALSFNSVDAQRVVEMFFIIAGFFLYYSCLKSETWFNFLKNKLARLFPVLAFSIAIGIIATFFGYSETQFGSWFLNLFFLQANGISLDYKGINWFVSSYFWAIIFYGYLILNFKKKYVNLIIALITYFSIVGVVSSTNGEFSRQTVNLFFNLGLLRALFGIGLGYFVAIFYEKIKQIKTGKIFSFVSSVLEISILYFLINSFFFNPINYQNKIIFSIVFVLFFILLLLNKGIASLIFSKIKLDFLGKYTYSIYVMQQISFNILGLSFWKNAKLIHNPFLCIFISIIFSIFIGILTFYLIEKPFKNFCIKKEGV